MVKIIEKEEKRWKKKWWREENFFFTKRKVIKGLEDFHLLKHIIYFISFLSKILGRIKHQVCFILMSICPKSFIYGLIFSNSYKIIQVCIWIFYLFYLWGAFLVAQLVKNLPAMQETLARFLGWEDHLEKEMATHSSILAWRIPWTKEPCRL